MFRQVDSLKEKLFEKLEQSLSDLQLKDEDISRCLLMSNDPSKLENNPESVAATAHEVTETEYHLYDSDFWYVSAVGLLSPSSFFPALNLFDISSIFLNSGFCSRVCGGCSSLSSNIS